jgi:hypothetical protein
MFLEGIEKPVVAYDKHNKLFRYQENGLVMHNKHQHDHDILGKAKPGFEED